MPMRPTIGALRPAIRLDADVIHAVAAVGVRKARSNAAQGEKVLLYERFAGLVAAQVLLHRLLHGIDGGAVVVAYLVSSMRGDPQLPVRGPEKERQLLDKE